MSNYNFKQSSKTRTFNFFRRVITIPIFEKMFVGTVLKSSSSFLKKMIPPDYLYARNSIREVTRGGIHFKLDISNVVDHCLYYGITDQPYGSILSEIKNATTILDIGANIGSTALFFASINSKARILAFEPHPDTFKRAQENLSRNQFKNIEFINLGLGESKATLKLYEVNEHNPGMNRILAKDKDLPFKSIHVEVLDKVMEERKVEKVDFIKLDVEGYEYSVLKGGAHILSSKPILFIELDDSNLRENNTSAKALIELLFSYGYRNFTRADNFEAITTETDFSNCHFDIIVK
ncbi:hypothetical protein BH11BAC2_BH11BAC2_00910 [soil metagenome]